MSTVTSGTPVELGCSSGKPTLVPTEGLGGFEFVVRYADSDLQRFPVVHQVDEPVPPDAAFAGPLYAIESDALQRQEQLENPYAVAGDHGSIATEITDRATPLYPLVAESDKGMDHNIEDVLTAVRRFVRGALGYDTDLATEWFSGGKSIHTHLPVYVTESKWLALNETATSWNEEREITVDASIYTPKRQFRLPWVVHDSKGMWKVPVTPSDSRTEIVRRAIAADRDTPATYLQILDETTPDGYPPLELHSRDTTEPSGPATELSVVERESRPEDYPERGWWEAHDVRNCFSPYGNTGKGTGRSVTVARAVDAPKVGPFCDLTDRHQYLPAYIIEAVSGNGEYTRSGGFWPIKLSKRDYPKVCEFDPGQHVVIIGGRSHQSRVFDVTDSTARTTATALRETGRDAAYDVLESVGYNTGSDGTHGSPSVASHGNSGESDTRAARLQRRAEQSGIEQLSHTEHLLVGNRLLRLRGFDGAMEWWADHSVAGFDRELTRQQLRSIQEAYPDL